MSGFFSIREDLQTVANPLIEVLATGDVASKLAEMPCRNARNETLVCFVDEGEIRVFISISFEKSSTECFPADSEAEPIIAAQEEDVSDAAKTPIVDKFLNPAKKKDFEKLVEAKRNESNDNFNNLDLEKAYTDLFEILWYSQLPCFDVKGDKAVDDEKVPPSNFPVLDFPHISLPFL